MADELAQDTYAKLVSLRDENGAADRLIEHQAEGRLHSLSSAPLEPERTVWLRRVMEGLLGGSGGRAKRNRAQAAAARAPG